VFSAAQRHTMKTTMMFTVAAMAVGVLFVCQLATAQIPIPNRYDGFSQGSPSSPILFEAFFDLLCPDCAAAWPNIRDVLAYYNPSGQPSALRFYLHAFPLPFHTWGYSAAQGAQAIWATSPQLIFKYVDTMFKSQAGFWNGQTAQMTGNQVQSLMATVAQQGTGFPSSLFLAGLQNSTDDMNARISWKYGCSRGVAGTPSFFVNGIQVQADPSWTLAEWRQILDPLLPSSFTHLNTHKTLSPSVDFDSLGSCPPGQKVCNYLPGKFQCCPPGENCVPNVGCRC